MHQLFNPANPMRRVAPAPNSAPAPHHSAGADIFGLTTAAPVGAGSVPAAPASAGVNQDLVGLFGSFEISDQASVASTPNPPAQNPFSKAPVAHGTAPPVPPQTSIAPSPSPAAAPQDRSRWLAGHGQPLAWWAWSCQRAWPGGGVVFLRH